MEIAAALSLITSIVAVSLSGYALYQTHLSPFELEVTNEDPRFILYEVTPEMDGNKTNNSWWLPVFTVGTTFHNTGQQSGKIEDIRISVDMGGENRTDIYEPAFIVDLNEFERHRQDRIAWMENAVVRNWYPFILRGNEEKSPHIVFQYWRWSEKQTGIMNISFEVKSSASEGWVVINKYDLVITEEQDYEKGVLANPIQ